MGIALALASLAFIFISGRNDGSPLVALPLQTLRAHPALPLALLWLVIPLVPLLGMWQVAASLQAMMGFGSGNQSAAFFVLLSVLVTLLAATLTNIPTSITLALVGALTGATIANGEQIDQTLLVRVLTLGVLAPLVAALLAFLLSKIPLRAWQSLPPRRLLAIYRAITFPSLALAYALNDGQKILFAGALALGVGVRDAAHLPLLAFGSSTVFILGTLSGLRRSGQFVRHGVTAVTPTALLWTEASTSLTVIGGSALGVPLSMTQSLTGALLGTGVTRSRRAIYWSSIRRIAIAWLWTLPFAGVLAYFSVLLTS